MSLSALHIGILLLSVLAVLGIGAFLGAFRTHQRGRIPFLRRPEQWAISIYSGASPTRLDPHPHASHPALTAADVTDIEADFVADPFLIHRDDRWYLFFEVLNSASRNGEIAVATSDDGFSWTYDCVVLAEPFHLSYPFLLEENDTMYMIPESVEVDAVRLYRANAFPYDWVPICTLLHGPYSDPTLFRHGGKWWMFASEWHQRLHLFYADSVQGPWHEHPCSPVVENDPRYVRPAGRVVRDTSGLIRFTQDSSTGYGSRVHAFRITNLSPEAYEESLLQEALLEGSGHGWNANRMHHVDLHSSNNDGWMAAVDGDAGQKLVFDIRDY